jgi:hypothetical protein
VTRANQPCLQAQPQTLAESLPRIGKPDLCYRRAYGFGGHRERSKSANLMFAGVTDAKILARASNEADGRRLWENSERLTSVTYPG